MTPFSSMLAQQEEGPGWLKALPAIIFFLLWALSAVASWWGKKQQQAKRRQAQEQIERSAHRQSAPAPAPIPTAPTPRRPQASRPKRPPVKPAPPPLPRAPAPPPVRAEVVEEGLVFQTEIGSGAELPRIARRSRPSAALLARNLGAGTIRANYLVHEVLRPPLSLRQDNGLHA